MTDKNTATGSEGMISETPGEVMSSPPAQQSLQSPASAQHVQPTPTGPVNPKLGWGDFLLGLIGQAILCAVVASACLYVYDQYFATKIVAMNVRPYMDEKKKAYVEGKLTEGELETELLKVKAAITGVPKNKVIILDEVVVGNAEYRPIQ